MNYSKFKKLPNLSSRYSSSCWLNGELVDLLVVSELWSGVKRESREVTEDPNGELLWKRQSSYMAAAGSTSFQAWRIVESWIFKIFNNNFLSHILSKTMRQTKLLIFLQEIDWLKHIWPQPKLYLKQKRFFYSFDPKCLLDYLSKTSF